MDLVWLPSIDWLYEFVWATIVRLFSIAIMTTSHFSVHRHLYDKERIVASSAV